MTQRCLNFALPQVTSLQSAELLAQQRQTELKRQRDEATEELAARLSGLR